MVDEEEKEQNWGVSSYDDRIEACGAPSESTYRHNRCRCVACVREKQENQERRLSENMVEHGTTTAYRYGCRCEDCVEQHTVAGVESEAEHGSTTKALTCDCDECRKVAAAYKKHWRAKRFADGNYTHGLTGYSVGCRCKECVVAKQQSRKKVTELGEES